MNSELFLRLKKETLYLSGAATWDSVTEHKWEVPADKRWFIFGGQVTRDAAETLNVTMHDSSDNEILSLLSEAAAAVLKSWPEEAYNTWEGMPLILDAGEYIKFAFGGNQGAGAKITGMALEIDV